MQTFVALDDLQSNQTYSVTVESLSAFGKTRTGKTYKFATLPQTPSIMSPSPMIVIVVTVAAVVITVFGLILCRCRCAEITAVIVYIDA
jgi:hypothetical protein